MFSNFFWVFYEKSLVTLIQFISIIILGRLLTPADYGIYGIIMVFISISDTFVDSGFGGALVQKKNISQNDINTLFLTNLLLSFVIYIILFIFAPLIENIYHVENLSLYLRTIGLVVIFYAISIVQNAIIMRDLRFRFSANVNLTASVLSTITAVVMAYYGYGIWSLIIMILMQALVSSVILWAKSRISVNIYYSLDSLKEFWYFGSNLLAANILQTVVNNIASAVIPKVGNLQQSGHYLQASKMNSIPVNVISMTIDKSLFPILAQYDTKSLLFEARRINRILLVLILPIFPLISLIAVPLVDFLLGDKWVTASQYLGIIIWSGIALMFQSLYRNIIKSLGLTRQIFYIEIIKSMLTLSIILISLKFGVLFLIWGIVVSSYIGVIVWAIFLKRNVKYQFKQQFFDYYKPVLSVFFVYYILSLINLNNYVNYLLIIPIGYSLYIFVVFMMRDYGVLIIKDIVKNRLVNHVVK